MSPAILAGLLHSPPPTKTHIWGRCTAFKAKSHIWPSLALPGTSGGCGFRILGDFCPGTYKTHLWVPYVLFIFIFVSFPSPAEIKHKRPFYNPLLIIWLSGPGERLTSWMHWMRPGDCHFVFVSAVILDCCLSHWLLMVNIARLAFITTKVKCQSLVLFF